MTSAPNKRFITFIVFCTTCLLQTAHAEQGRWLKPAPHRFTIQLPAVDRAELIEQVRALRSQLILRKQALMQIIADKQLDSRDAFLMTLMPGGLLYAGYRKATCEQARNELASVTADIEEFSSDLLAMQSGSTPVVVAQLRRSQ